MGVELRDPERLAQNDVEVAVPLLHRDAVHLVRVEVRAILGVPGRENAETTDTG